MGDLAWWQWVVDVAGVLVILVVLYGVALVVRRRLLARHGGTFELSHRVSDDRDDRGWVLGLGRYSGETLQWFRIFSLSPRPKRTWRRTALGYDGQRAPASVERASLYPDHLVISCHAGGGEEIQLAMSPGSLTGFQAWLEASPPGADWSR